MVVGEYAEAVDLVVVGAGPGGYTASLRAAELGRNVLLVDRDGDAGLGGVCLHHGCIPSEALIQTARTAFAPTRLAGAGLRMGQSSIDMGQFQAWKQGIVETLASDVSRMLRAAKVRVMAGTLRLTRPNQAVVETPEGKALFLEFQDLIVATGSRPAALPHLQRDGERVLDSTDVLALTALPESVAVIGLDYIGLELGTALAKLGSRVILVEATNRLLPAFDRTLSRAAGRQLPSLGIVLYTEAEATGFEGRSLEFRARGVSTAVQVDAVIVCAGRVANTEDLGLERTGITAGDSGLLYVGPDRRLTRHIAAIGDITAGPQVAHKARAEGIVAAEALSGGAAAFDSMVIPQVVCSDPEIATAGLTVEQARAQGMDISVRTVPLRASARAMILGGGAGFMQIVMEAQTDRVVGVHVAAPNAGEIIAEGVLAIEMAASSLDVALTLHPHPTISELMSQACAAAVRSPRAQPEAVQL